MRNVSAEALGLVAAGGAAGCVVRYLIGVATADVSGVFPWGTLGINVAGSFVLGAVIGCLPPDHAGRLLFGTGFCGGFTTFSTFSLDAVSLFERGAHLRASLYVMASVALSVLATVSGATVGRVMGATR